MAQPHQRRGQRQIPDQLVGERRLKGGIDGVTRRPVGQRDRQPPRQVSRTAEQLLVEVVPDPPDPLGDQQGRRDRVHEQRHIPAVPAHPPRADRGRHRDRAPDPQPAVPHREHAIPDVRDVHRRGDVEVDPPADDSRRDPPQGDIPDQIGITARRPPPATGDDDRRRDAHQVHQRVHMDEQRADMETADRRTGDMHRHLPRLTPHPPARTSAPAAGPTWGRGGG